MTGRSISHYEILEKLGDGGMGAVYKAQDSRLGRSVALKFVKAQFSERWEREARAIAALNHPHIATLYDVGQHEGAPYLAMEFVEGHPLEGPRPVKEVIEYGIQIADGLAAAHAAGIVHRDLKPGNILVTDKGSVKILDFGLAKLAERPGGAAPSDKTQTAAIAGTPGYMSPEQIEGKPVDSRSDIFAFGCVLYELASGHRAFEGDSVGSVLAATATQEPKPLGGVPEKLDELIQRCIRKDPERRWQHIGDARIALEDIRDAPAPVRQAKPRARSRLLPILAGAAIGIALLMPATLAWLRGDSTVDISLHTPTPFATSLQIPTTAAWSPDGKSIAFVGRTKGPETDRLYVQMLDSTRPQPITEPPFAGAPFYSPVSSKHVYFTATIDGTNGLWRGSLAPGKPTLVRPHVSYAGFSPDGRTLAFLRSDSPGVWIASPPEAPARQYAPSPFQPAESAILSGICFAPDGKKILVRNAPPEREAEVWLLPWPPGEAPRHVVFDMPEQFGQGATHCWLPDSRHVLFQSMRQASLVQRAFLGDVTTGRVWLVLGETQRVVPAAVSPDGTKVIYRSSLLPHHVIEVPLDGGPVQDLLGSYRREYMPAFSPAERTLVYVTDRRGDLEVWMESLTEPSWERLLLKPSDFRLPSGRAFFLMTPVFSPDSQWVAVVGGNRLWIAGVAGSPPERISAEEENEFAPTWSPDGQWIAYLRYRQRKMSLAKVRVGRTSESPIDLVEDLATTVLPEWSPVRGGWIACAVLNKPGITLVNPETKEKRILKGVSAPHAWSRDGNTIYQVRGTNNCSLWAIDVPSGRKRLIRELGDLCPATPLYPGYRISVAPDGKSIAYAVGRPSSELWLLDGLRIPRPWYYKLLGLR